MADQAAETRTRRKAELAAAVPQVPRSPEQLRQRQAETASSDLHSTVLDRLVVVEAHQHQVWRQTVAREALARVEVEVGPVA